MIEEIRHHIYCKFNHKRLGDFDVRSIYLWCKACHLAHCITWEEIEKTYRACFDLTLEQFEAVLILREYGGSQILRQTKVSEFPPTAIKQLEQLSIRCIATKKLLGRIGRDGM